MLWPRELESYNVTNDRDLSKQVHNNSVKYSASNGESCWPSGCGGRE